jgi:hypothetical protein
LTNSSSKGIPEKEYAFDIELFDEILPEVRYDVLISKHISLKLTHILFDR